MAKGQITIEIDEDGTSTIEVNGIKGPSCLALTKALEDALGQAASRTTTTEYREREQAPLRHRQRA